MIGIYVHVPFCLRKCPYCSFYSVPFSAENSDAYVEAVCRNMERYRDVGAEADTLYFGGGTPSVLGAEQIWRIVKTCREVFGLKNAEITLEANPCTVDEEKLIGYRQAGVNRLSFGIQSADDEKLRFLGRLHDRDTAVKAVELAAKVGFTNISGDLMLGSVGEDSESIKRSVDALCALPLNHISAYMLKIEEGTAFDCDEVRNKVADDDKMCDLYLTAAEELEAHGFMQYEISNFAKDGFQSRHNNKYWECEEYLGFGPSAHSFYGGKRYCCPSDVKRFIESEIQPEIITEESVDSGEEYILLGLRLSIGISLDRVAQLYSPEAAESLLKRAKLFESHGLAEVGEDRVKLTRKGYLVSNGIIAELIDAVNS